jgi:TonB family protein
MRHRETFRSSRCRLIAGALACFSQAVAAQDGVLGTGGIRGIVRDSIGQAIIGAQIAISGSRLIVETDDSGRFELAKVRPGMLTLKFRRLGFQPDTVELVVLAGKTIPLDVTLARLNVSLTPVVITGRSDLKGWREGFYHRKTIGAGHYFTAADIDKRNPRLLSDMFRGVPGVTVQPSRGMIRNALRFRGKGGCAPLTVLDGTPLAAAEFDIDLITPFSVAAVELYPGSIVPPQFTVAPGIGRRTCGAVVIWSKHPERRPKASAPNVGSAASEIARLVDNRQIFTAAQVDITARQDSARPVRPAYPDDLFDAQVNGAVMVEFIVTETGAVDPDRISIVSATHPGFVDAVRAALQAAVYSPAVRGGYPVHQYVQHEFHFVADAGAKRKK